MLETEESRLDRKTAGHGPVNDSLIAEKERLVHLLSCAPSVTYSYEANGDYSPTFISENIRDMFGYEPQEYLLDPAFVQRRVHPDDASRVQTELSRLFKAGHIILEYRFLCKDGRYCWVSDEMRLIRDKNGQPVEVVGSWTDISTRKQVSEALVKAQQRLTHVLAASPTVIYSFEGKGEHEPTFISENVKDIFGYEPREYLENPKFMPSCIHPDDLARIDKEWSRLFRVGHHVNEYRFRRKDGSYCWVSDELRLLRDKDGEPVEIVGAICDITARKKAEDELATTKNRLKHLMTSAPAVIYSFAVKGEYLPTFISENVRDLLGYEPDEYLSDRNFVPLRIHPEDAARVQDDLSRLFELGYLVHEYRFRRKDGIYCWVSDELHVLRDENGKPAEVVGSWSDVSARRKLGDAMVAAQNRLNHLLTSAPAVIYSFEATGSYAPTFISENVKALLGYEPKEYLESPDFWWRRVHPDDVSRVRENLDHLFEAGQLNHEYRFLRKDGSYCWINDEMHLIRDKDGQPVEVVASMNDISARKKAEEDLARLHDLETAYLAEIEKEKQHADDLLHAIFPHPIVQELKSTNVVKPRRYENIAVIFTDIVGFTSYCDGRPPEEVIPRLQVLIEAFEDISVKHGLEKIKTIGDAFMATSGLLAAVENPVLACIKAGFDMISAVRSLTPDWQIRVGIHSGPVVAGLVGRRQYSFDLWGDTVNTAARIVDQAPAGEIALSATAWLRVRTRCRCESLGRMDIKGKGLLELYRCIGQGKD
jgi:PAS domain S-box-containing protein